MNKNRIRLTESQLYRVIKESVARVLNEATHSRTISSDGVVYDDPTVPQDYDKEWLDGEWNEYANSRWDGLGEYHKAAQIVDHLNGNIPDWERKQNMNRDWSDITRDTMKMQEIPSDMPNDWRIYGNPNIWKGVNEPKAPQRDRKMERSLASADKRPLHRKDSLNRAMDESIRRAIRKVLH